MENIKTAMLTNLMTSIEPTQKQAPKDLDESIYQIYTRLATKYNLSTLNLKPTTDDEQNQKLEFKENLIMNKNKLDEHVSTAYDNHFSYEHYIRLVNKYVKKDSSQLNFQNRVIIPMLEKLLINTDIEVVDTSPHLKAEMIAHLSAMNQ